MTVCGCPLASPRKKYKTFRPYGMGLYATPSCIWAGESTGDSS